MAKLAKILQNNLRDIKLSWSKKAIYQILPKKICISRGRYWAKLYIMYVCTLVCMYVCSLCWCPQKENNQNKCRLTMTDWLINSISLLFWSTSLSTAAKLVVLFFQYLTLNCSIILILILLLFEVWIQSHISRGPNEV